MTSDLAKMVGLFLISVVLGISLDAVRGFPLALLYLPPKSRVMSGVENIQEGKSTPPAKLNREVGKEQVLEMSRSRSAVILDARDEMAFRLGHIPSARSLPRDDFEQSYKREESL